MPRDDTPEQALGLEHAGGAPSGDLLQDAVAALLRRVPERWAEYDADPTADPEFAPDALKPEGGAT